MRLPFLIVILSLVFISTACSDYQKVLKSGDSDLQYEKALDYYNDEDYVKAIQLLDQLRSSVRGTEKAEEVYYYYAFAHYHNTEYILASYYFKTFVKNFPKSDKREECLYMAAYCKYKQAPAYYLDQSATREAINEFRLFADRYPDSERVSDAQEHIQELHRRLEKKEYEKATLYYKMEDWKVAAYAFNVFLDKYPASQHREVVLFKILKARHEYAKKSIEGKQPVRYNEAIQAYQELAAEYPESRFMDEAEQMYKKSKEKLQSLKENNSISTK
ncbi:MAG: outer membrane protein assembly factor BamD [Bacteroidales bacterium]